MQLFEDVYCERKMLYDKNTTVLKKNIAREHEKESHYGSPFYASVPGFVSNKTLRNVSVLVWS